MPCPVCNGRGWEPRYERGGYLIKVKCLVCNGTKVAPGQPATQEEARAAYRKRRRATK
jgi:hypothetical protein